MWKSKKKKKKKRERKRKERSINIYTLLCIRWIAVEKLLCSTGNPIWHPVMTWSNEMGGGKGGFGRRDVCILIIYIYRYTYVYFVLLYGRNQHNIVKKIRKKKNKRLE